MNVRFLRGDARDAEDGETAVLAAVANVVVGVRDLTRAWRKKASVEMRKKYTVGDCVCMPIAYTAAVRPSGPPLRFKADHKSRSEGDGVAGTPSKGKLALTTASSSKKLASLAGLTCALLLVFFIINSSLRTPRAGLHARSVTELHGDASLVKGITRATENELRNTLIAFLATSTQRDESIGALQQMNTAKLLEITEKIDGAMLPLFNSKGGGRTAWHESGLKLAQSHSGAKASSSYSMAYCTNGTTSLDGLICCPHSCGDKCGYPGCASPELGGREKCCASRITRPCSGANDIACRMKFCYQGELSPDGQYCCAKSCGPGCGKKGCGKLLGGAARCCRSKIMRSCFDNSDTICKREINPPDARQ